MPAASQAVAGVCVNLTLNAFTILIGIQVFTSINVIAFLAALPKIEITLISIAPVVAVLAYWVPGSRYKKVIDEFERLDREGTRQKNLTLKVLNWGYQILTVVLFALAAYILRLHALHQAL